MEIMPADLLDTLVVRLVLIGC